jgi:hypothetical protein
MKEEISDHCCYLFSSLILVCAGVDGCTMSGEWSTSSAMATGGQKPKANSASIIGMSIMHDGHKLRPVASREILTSFLKTSEHWKR